MRVSFRDLLKTNPHGQGFIAATSMKFAEKAREPTERDIVAWVYGFQILKQLPIEGSELDRLEDSQK